MNSHILHINHAHLANRAVSLGLYGVWVMRENRLCLTAISPRCNDELQTAIHYLDASIIDVRCKIVENADMKSKNNTRRSISEGAAIQ